MSRRPPVSLQESMLTALALASDRWGAQVATQVEPRHFDERNRPLAEALLKYRRDYHEAPGLAHLDEVVDDVGLRGERREDITRIVASMVAQWEAGFNGRYIASQVSKFVRQQAQKDAVMEAAEILNRGGDGHEDEVERVLNSALRYQHSAMDAGLFLSDTRGLEFLDKPIMGYALGIKPLDDYGIGPVPGRLLLYIAAKGTGKTWFCVHVGRRCLQQRARVVHVSLEMDEPEVYERYIQNFFDAARTDERVKQTLLEYEDSKFEMRTRRRRPKLAFSDPDAREQIRAKVDKWGTRLGRNLVIKRFPSGSLTVSKLSAYLDFLELTEKFVPQVLMIDYPDLMKIDASNYRHSLGQTYVDLRGIAGERNLALVCPTQGTRLTLTAKHVKSKDASEDIRKIHTADNVVTYSQTEQEEELGLARLKVEHARHAPDGFTVLISQSYPTGQYVLDAMYYPKKYWDEVKAKTGSDARDEED